MSTQAINQLIQVIKPNNQHFQFSVKLQSYVEFFVEIRAQHKNEKTQ